MRSLVGGAATTAALLLLAGCASGPPTPGPDVETIRYETGPGYCFGRCETLTFTAASDGRVWVEREWHVEGEYREWRAVRHRRQASPEQFAQFRAALAAYRPVGERRLDAAPPCATFAYDLPDITVTWRGGGPDGSLHYDFGCDRETGGDMRDALKAAPTLLGLEHPDGPPAPR